jgi:hypothetical protein
MSALGVVLALATALRVPGPLSPRNASYRIDASLDAEQKRMTGRAQLTWRNRAAAPARELVFHLYWNAFKNEASTFLAESHGGHRRSQLPKHGWGAIDVVRLRVDGVDRTAALRVVDTLATLPLETAIAPGATVEVELEWTAQLPRLFARAGWFEDFFAVGQWFPKIAVFDGQWRAEQYHLNSEFFADFGVYDVTLDVPARLVVAATGVALGEQAAGARKRLHFYAEDVHDFAFAACPRFRRTDEQIDGVRVSFYGIPGHEANVPRHLAAARAGLRELGRLGPYPYTQLSIVDVPDGAEGASGMEYPTLFFTAEIPVPRGVHLPELVTLHELAHQYFQGMVASDEVGEAWLDEGLAETFTDLGLSAMFGRAAGVYQLGSHRLGLSEASRLSYRAFAAVDPLAARSFDFLNNRSYGAISYAKTNCVMRTVEALVGRARFEAGLRRYFETWRFRHPRAADLVAAFDAGADASLDDFWGAAIRRTEIVDQEVFSVDARRLPAPAGLFDADGGARREVEPQPEAHAPWRSEVVVHDKGDWALPVEVEVAFADGTRRRERWNGAGARWTRFVYDREVDWARVEAPPLDVNRWNDGLRAAPDRAPRRRLTAAWQLLLSTLAAAVGF